MSRHRGFGYYVRDLKNRGGHCIFENRKNMVPVFVQGPFDSEGAATRTCELMNSNSGLNITIKKKEGFMKNAILIELAKRWEKDAAPGAAAPWPGCIPGSAQDIQREKAMSRSLGHRECKRECADAIRMLVGVLGGSDA